MAKGRSQQTENRSQGFVPHVAARWTQDSAPVPATPCTQHPTPASPNPEPFDFILLDCPPSLGLLTINALTFAEEVFVPMQAHFLALQGLSKLLETVGFIRSSFNPAIKVSGIILCMHEKQTLLAGEVTADLNAFLDTQRDQDVPWRDAEVLQPAIRRNIKLAESPSFGATIYQYAPESNGADDYRRLAESVVRQHVRR
jgi:chromosome partitioning protein